MHAKTRFTLDEIYLPSSRRYGVGKQTKQNKTYLMGCAECEWKQRTRTVWFRPKEHNSDHFFSSLSLSPLLAKKWVVFPFSGIQTMRCVMIIITVNVLTRATATCTHLAVPPPTRLHRTYTHSNQFIFVCSFAHPFPLFYPFLRYHLRLLCMLLLVIVPAFPLSGCIGVHTAN